MKKKVKLSVKRRRKLQSLHDKAWDLMSIFVRKRDKRCVTCGKQYWDEELGEPTIKGLQAGHFWHGVLDFDEMNINAQCGFSCNKMKSGNLAAYSVYLINKYGIDEFHKLDQRHSAAQKGEKRSEEDYLKLIEELKLRVQSVDNSI